MQFYFKLITVLFPFVPVEQKPPIPTGNYFLLLQGSNFLLLNGQNLSLL